MLAVFLAFLLLAAVLVVAPVAIRRIIIGAAAVHPLLELVFHFVAFTLPLSGLRLPAALGRQGSSDQNQSDKQNKDRRRRNQTLARQQGHTGDRSRHRTVRVHALEHQDRDVEDQRQK